MVKLKVSKDEFDKIASLLPDICPDISFSLKEQDDNLMKLGFCESAPCIVEFDMSTEEFNEIFDILDDIEVDAFNTPHGSYPSHDDPAYQKYLKYAYLSDILFFSE